MNPKIRKHANAPSESVTNGMIVKLVTWRVVVVLRVTVAALTARTVTVGGANRVARRMLTHQSLTFLYAIDLVRKRKSSLIHSSLVLT